LLLAFVAVSLAGPLPTVRSVEERLADQIQRMIDAGHLAPGVCYFEQHYKDDSKRHGYELDDYWHNPGELIYTLAIAIPYLPGTIQSAARQYIQNEFNLYPPHTFVHMGPAGALREAVPRPPEYATAWAGPYAQLTQSQTSAIDWGTSPFPWVFPPFNIYACWKYAELFPAQAASILQSLQGKVQAVPNLGDWDLEHPHVLNAYIAGYYGYLNLQDLVGETRSSQVQLWLNNALQRRLQSLNLDPRTLPGAEAGGFLLLVPELGDYLWANARSRVETVLSYQAWAAPYWHIARAEEITRVDEQREFWEGYHSHIYETSSQFLGRAYALKWPRATMERYLDAPGVYRGDLTYIQNLVSTLQGSDTGTGAPSSPQNLRIVQ
jgi:hypothetical protein